MTFQPRMTAVREGVTVLAPLKWRAWNGVIADLWHAECSTAARGEYVSDHPRLFIVLDKAGGEYETRLDARRPGPVSCGASSVTYFPANVPVWSRTQRKLQLRHLDLHFDAEAIRERIGERLSPELLTQPQLMLAQERILPLAHLLAAECAEPNARHDLYGDGLMLAIFIDLFGIGRRQARKRMPLTPAQLRRVTDHIAANPTGPVRLQDLAALVDLSQSHFSHAFKESTGLPPHQWQLQARIQRGQDMLIAGDRSLTEIAALVGFCDQAHFTRAFRRIVGETPAAWKRSLR